MLYQQQASPQRQKNPQPPPVRENKLRLFLKRSSEPLLNLQNESQKVSFSFFPQSSLVFFLSPFMPSRFRAMTINSSLGFFTPLPTYSIF
jgi:hypothetical protein